MCNFSPVQSTTQTLKSVYYQNACGNNRELIKSTFNFQHLLTYHNLTHRSIKLFFALYPTLDHSWVKYFPQHFVFRCCQFALLSRNRDDIALIKRMAKQSPFVFVNMRSRQHGKSFRNEMTKIFHISFLITYLLYVCTAVPNNQPCVFP
jgi:hypothetical protein